MTRTIRDASIVCVLATLALAGCGGDSSSPTGSTTPPGGSSPPEVVPPVVAPSPAAIQGIATPSSISVVTATNVN